MANKHRGEYAFEANGQTYTVCFSSNALASAEDALGVGIGEIGELLGDVSKLRIKTVRGLLWAGLSDHHKGLTVEDVGRIIDEVTINTALEIIGEGFSRALPDAKKANGSGDDRPPPQPAQDGTGPAS